MKNKILIIIPAYNEQDNILKTYKTIIDYNKKNKTDYEVIVINDGSKDKTEKILKDNKIPHITLIHNLGIGGAMQTGYKYAFENDYDIAVQYDGDGQHDVRYIKDLIDKLKSGSDMVIGSRFIEEKSKFKSTMARRLGINIISFFIKLFTKKKIYDTTSGFRACNRKVISKFAQFYPTEYPEPISNFELLKQGFKISEVPVEMNERQGGQSSINSWKNIYYMINVILSIIIISFRRYK